MQFSIRNWVIIKICDMEEVMKLDCHEDVIKWNISALFAICEGNSPAIGEFPAQRPVTRSFDVFFDVRLNKRLSKH